MLQIPALNNNWSEEKKTTICIEIEKGSRMRNLPHMNVPNQQDWVCGQAVMLQGYNSVDLPFVDLEMIFLTAIIDPAGDHPFLSLSC